MTSLSDPVEMAHGRALRNRLALAPLTNTQSHPDGTLSEDETAWLEAQEAIEAASDALGALQALAGLGDLSFGNPLTPVTDEAGSLAGVADPEAAAALGRALEGG